MFQSGNHQFLKSLNRRHILNLLRMHQGLTARQLSELTELKIATVINLLKELEAEQQIVRKEIGRSTKQGGKRPVIWDINPHYGLALGVEWLSSQIRLALIDFNLHIMARQIVDLPLKFDDLQKIDWFVKQLRRFLSKYQANEQQVLGVGIGLAGIIDFEHGVVVASYSFNTHSFPLKKLLAQRLPFPIYLDNESNAGALGLKWMMPELFQARNIIYLTIHQCFSGMGAGFIFDHELYRGKQNATGEWPAALFDKNFFSGLIQKLNHENHPLIDLLKKESTLKEICELAQTLTKKNDPIAIRFWQWIAEPIAQRLHWLNSLLDPDITVVGGDIFEVRPYLEPALREKIKQLACSEEIKQPSLWFSPFGSYTNALGAAVTVLNDVYSR